MFSFITMNWRGRPLTSLRTVIELISATTTMKITDAELAALPLEPHHHQCPIKRGVSPYRSCFGTARVRAAVIVPLVSG
jgi:hypothetical protein